MPGAGLQRTTGKFAILICNRRRNTHEDRVYLVAQFPLSLIAKQPRANRIGVRTLSYRQTGHQDFLRHIYCSTS